MGTHVPDANHQRRQQAARENASRLQSTDRENVSPVVGVGAPVVNDVENLRAQDPREHHEDTQVPRVVAINALLLGIADADPEPQQDAGCDKHTVRRQVKVADLKKSREHVSLDATERQGESSRKQLLVLSCKLEAEVANAGFEPWGLANT